MSALASQPGPILDNIGRPGITERKTLQLLRNFLLLSLLATSPGLSRAETSAIPDALRAWIPWVLRDQPDHACPRIATQADQKRCLWPGQLKVDISADKAQFSQSWQLYGANNVVALPGNSEYWPDSVLLDNQPAAVLEVNGKPTLLLAAGNYMVTGSIGWKKPPQYLQVAPETGLIQVSRDGKKVAAQLDPQGRLWLRDQAADARTEQNNDSIKVEVFRLLSDDIPMRLETELRLAVAGKPREIVLGRLLPPGAEVVEFNSPLPARIEPDGRLRIQARSGEWRLALGARFLAAINQLAMEKLDPAWPDQEIWSFRADPQLRGVKVSGLAAVDPSQLDIPPGFAGLPTYLMAEGQTLTLQEQYRGDASPAANRLTLLRTMWVDFDGGGATTRDIINGTFTHNWRLRSSADLQLGRIVANGEPQLVTRMAGEEGSGIEVRHPEVSIQAINRIAPLKAVSAHGWLHTFDSVELQLRLPPGWQLWHAVGPDRVETSWLSSWDLWDLFICLLIVGGLSRVIHWRWGLLGAFTLALTYHETGAPLFSWALLVGALPLLAILPEGKVKALVNTIAHLTLTVLVIIVIAFAVQQVRRGIYPQLEQHRAINVDRYDYSASSAPAASREITPEEGLVARAGIARLSSEQKLGHNFPKEASQKRYRPGDNVQTGPGEPSWQWRQENLAWSGPVKADALLQLYLSPPWLTRTLRFVQIGLVLLLLFGLGGRLLRYHWLFGRADDDGKSGGGNLPRGITSVLFIPILVIAGSHLVAPPAQAEAFPPESLLRELKASLTKAPECMPQCAAVDQTRISVTQHNLIIRQRVNSGAEIAFPLPADKSWQTSAVQINGRPSALASADNRLWVHLLPGHHDITLTTSIKGDRVSIPFPLTPHNTEVAAPGWLVHGLTDGGVAGGTIQLEKEVKQVAQDTLLPAPVKAFVVVKRQLNSDIDWQLITTVERVAPLTGAINLRIPLIDGESVVSQTVLTAGNDVVVALGERQHQVQWRSVIEPTEKLTLAAPKTDEWVEHWRILASPRWHISGAGIPPIKTDISQGPVIQLWRPWPGENLTLNAVQPQPVAGPTTTVESVEIDHRPGARSAALKLSLQIRTSLGGDYRIPQPPGAELQSIVIDATEQTTPREGEQVVIPLRPGVQSAIITWELEAGIGLATSTPTFLLPTPASNIDIKLQMPRDRWPILLNGPDIGPAMLYWGVLAVILIIAAALGNITRRQSLSVPVNTWQWLLLALGMSTVNMVGSIPVVLWFFAMEARRRRPPDPSSSLFNIVQIGLVGLSIIALLSLFYTIPESLLSAPNMQVAGNGSSNYFYQWYQDHSSDSLPQGWVFSLPLLVFRIAMLAWSLWIVFALLRWMKWGWLCLSTGQLWNNTPVRRVRRAPKNPDPEEISEEKSEE